MASHPLDGMVPLTPGHFLVGRALTAYPTEKIDYNPGPLQRWAHCTKDSGDVGALSISNNYNELQNGTEGTETMSLEIMSF